MRPPLSLSPRAPNACVRNACCALALLIAGCQDEPQVSVAVEPIGDMKHTMNWVLDPAADAIWGASGFVMTEEGEQDLTPTTEEGWNAVKHAAAVLAESGNLLQMPHMLPSGEAGSAAWAEFSRGMTRIAGQAMEAASAEDSEALFEIGGHLYNVCVACHQVYAREEEMGGDSRESP